MAAKPRVQQRNATIQWIALVVVAVLAVLAAFTLFGDDSGRGGGHSGFGATTHQL
jgi:hypothetical protein